LTLIKGARFHQFLVLAAAGEKEQGDAHEVLGDDGVNAGITQTWSLLGWVRPPCRSWAMSGERKKRRYVSGKVGRGKEASGA
jgi:hypothetical protein